MHICLFTHDQIKVDKSTVKRLKPVAVKQTECIEIARTVLTVGSPRQKDEIYHTTDCPRTRSFRDTAATITIII
jgi:hypothetical protein